MAKTLWNFGHSECKRVFFKTAVAESPCCTIYLSVYMMDLCPFQNHFKNLGPSNETDLEFWGTVPNLVAEIHKTQQTWVSHHSPVSPSF